MNSSLTSLQIDSNLDLSKKFIFPLIATVIILYLSSRHSYVLFQYFVNFFSIILSCGIFITVWNSRELVDNSSFIYLGISYFFIAIIDFTRSFSAIELNSFPAISPDNLRTQLWIAARYMESFSLLIAFSMLNIRNCRTKCIFTLYTLITSFLLLSIFYWHNFPTCHLQTIGATAFKQYSEYLIAFILTFTIYVLYRKRTQANSSILYLFSIALTLFIFSVLTLSFNVKNSMTLYFIGHILKLFSFYLLYQAVTFIGFKAPYTFLTASIKVKETELKKTKKILEAKIKKRSEELIAVNSKLKSSEELLKTTNSSLREKEKKLQSKHDESELAAYEIQKLSIAIDHSPAITIISDKDGNIEYANQKFSEMTGYSIDTITGQNCKFLKTGFHGKDFYADLWKTINSGKVWQGEFCNKKKDGTEYWESALIAPIFNSSNKIKQFIKVAEDITEQKKAKQEKEALQQQLQQSQKMDAIGALAGGISHDVNNILCSIKGQAELILEETDPSSQTYEDIKTIINNTDFGANLTKQLLLFSSSRPITIKTLNINIMLKNILTMIRRLIGENIKINSSLNAKTGNFAGDQSNIEQVLMNLVLNAKDSMPKGGTITIETKNISLDEEYCKLIPDSSPGEYIYLSIEDNGCGMDKETLDRIYEPFFTTKTNGTGLGLSVTYGIIKKINGFINVYSEPGRGSTFKLYLPVLDADINEITNPEPARPHLELNDKKQIRILLVEDEYQVRLVAKRILEKKGGYTVFEAENYTETMEIFEKEKGNFDIVFSDTILPGKSGITLIKDLQKLNPKIQFLLSSGYNDEKIQSDTESISKFAFIQKPYGVFDLLTAIQKVLLT